MATARWPDPALPALLLGAAGIGLAPIFVRWSELGPAATAFYRLFFALPFLFAYLRHAPAPVTPRHAPRTLRDFALLLMAGAFFGTDLALWHGSLHFTSVANATILTNFAPVYVTLFAFAAGERFRPLFLLGLAMAIGGALLLVGVSLDIDRYHVIGDALGLSSAVFYGAYLYTVARLRQRFTVATVMAWGGLGATLVLSVIAWVSGESLLATTLAGWGVLLALALVSQVGGQGLITYALAHLPAAFSAVALLMQPAVAAAAAWVLLDEAMGPVQGIGAAIVLAGIVVAKQGTTLRPAADDRPASA